MKSFYTAFFLLLGLGLTAQEAPQEENKTSNFFLTGNVSYAYRTAKAPEGISEQQKDYLEELRSGISFDLGAYYKIDGEFAIGLKYNRYHSEMELNNVTIMSTPAGDSGIGNLSDDISISYYGFSIMYLTESDGPHLFSVEAGLGYMYYSNNANALGSYTFKGGNVGGALTISYKYAFSEHFAVGPQIGLIGTALSEIKVEGPGGYNQTMILKDENKESLTRIDFGITAMYTF